MGKIKKSMSKTIILVAILIFCSTIYLPLAQAQDYSIDQMLANSWQHFKNTKISPSGQVWANDDKSNNLVYSESQSYGLLLALWNRDEASFDKIWNWTKQNLQRNSIRQVYFANENRWITTQDPVWQQKIATRADNLFAWRWKANADGKGKPGVVYYEWVSQDENWQDGFDAASDGDEDIALALVEGDRLIKNNIWKKTNYDYLAEAKKIIPDIWSKETFAIDPAIVENFSKGNKWLGYNGNASANLSFDQTNKILKFSYNISPGGWAGAYRIINRSLVGRGLTIQIKATNQIRLALQEKNSNGEIFEYRYTPPKSFNTNWIPFTSFTQRKDYQPAGAVLDGKLDLNNIYSIIIEPVFPSGSGSGSVEFSKIGIYADDPPYLSAGDRYPEINGVNPSYLAPYAYKIFSQVDPTHSWPDLIKSSYRIINDMGKVVLTDYGTGHINGATNLPLNWIALKDDDQITNNEWWRADAHFDYRYWEAFRALFRVSLDWNWNKNPGIKNYFTANGTGPYNFLLSELNKNGRIYAEYYRDGTPVRQYETCGMDAVYLDYFNAAGNSVAVQKILKNIKSLYNPAGYCGSNSDEYFNQVWFWLGLAAYNGKLTNFIDK